MALQVGDIAPDFTLLDETGAKVTLSSLRGHNVVLVFYPLDFSPTCTKELHGMTERQADYDAKDAIVLGISVDSKWAHAAFKRDEKLSARLLADFHPKGAVARLYDVYLEESGIAKRGTFVLDREGLIRGVTINSPKDARDEEAYFAALATCPA